eukprot:CAMPEP_0182913788 /NCGR_PEP_ID=MMETSP0034_2-20130328/38219_1 /TAXON_ID=156128 /ORGANISM="Nephroselmis pyriformis, Strain CCMP717" /LENGTH=280 /DNA_ID=CAMNT_0025050517 /DNA_START=151 /DNA_END=990 /DNA_ORIENTATION=+
MGLGPSRAEGAAKTLRTSAGSEIFPFDGRFGGPEKELDFESIALPEGVIEQTDSKNILQTSEGVALGDTSTAGEKKNAMEGGNANGDYDDRKKKMGGWTRKLDSKPLPTFTIQNIGDSIDQLTQQKLRNRFNILDKEQTGHVDISKVSILLSLVGENPVQTRLQEIMEETLPVNRARTSISFQEFLLLWYKHKEELKIDDLKVMLKDAFQYLDQDESGSLSFEEFKEVLTEVGDGLSNEECRLFFESVDKSGDGLLQYDEFLQFFMADLMNARKMYRQRA